MSNTKLSIKVQYLTDIRRISLETQSFQLLHTSLKSLFKIPEADVDRLEVRYKDDEGDMILICSDVELEEAVFISKNQTPSLLRLYVTVKPEVKKRSCGQHEWRRSWWHLQRRALNLFKSTLTEDLEEARRLLLEQSALRPEHPTPIYNLACVEARLGNTEEALAYLEKSITAGFRNVHHIENDSDLDSLRTVEKYQSIVSNLKKEKETESPEQNRRGGRCGRFRQRKMKWHFIQEQVNQLFESGEKEDLEAARCLLNKQLYICPGSPIPMYNLACVESLLGNLPEAIEYLTKAVSMGYSDVDHIEKDEDLIAIRNLPEYESIVSNLKLQKYGKCDGPSKTECPQFKTSNANSNPSMPFQFPAHWQIPQELPNQLWNWCHTGIHFLTAQINRLFESGTRQDLEKARDLLFQQLSFNPANPVPIYNIACVESLLGEFFQALYYLEQAIKAGYTDLAHIEKDTDLDPLRHMEQFQSLINSLKNKRPQHSTSPKPKPQQPEQKPKEQQQPEQIPKEQQIPKAEPEQQIPKEKPQPEQKQNVETKNENVQKHKYDAAAEVLASMGWIDREKNLSILELTSGDLSRAVTLLLEQ